VAKYQDKLINVSVTATQENTILNQLDTLKATWYRVDYDVVLFNRDLYKIVGFDNIVQVIDESMS